MRRVLLIRTAIAVVALVVAAWFALGVRQARDTDHVAAAILALPRLSQAQANWLDSILAGAAFLNPDRQIDLLRSAVALASGHQPRAQRIAAGVTRAEPLNLQAWTQLARTSHGASAIRALKQVAALAPPVRGDR
jgi:hypothetical protein